MKKSFDETDGAELKRNTLQLAIKYLDLSYSKLSNLSPREIEIVKIASVFIAIKVITNILYSNLYLVLRKLSRIDW